LGPSARRVAAENSLRIRKIRIAVPARRTTMRSTLVVVDDIVTTGATLAVVTARQAKRNVPVQRAKRMMGRWPHPTDTVHIPIRFDQAGVYPYFCHQHLGMIGVVVVGDGRGEAAAPAVVADFPGARPAATEATAAGRGAPWSLAVAALLGLGVAGGALVAARRRRARRPAAPAPEV